MTDAPPPEIHRRTRMPAWLPRAMVLFLTLVGVFQLASWAFHQLLNLLVLLLVSFFLSLAVEPAVQWLAGFGMRRGLAAFLVFILMFGAIGVFVSALGSLLVDQVIDIASKFPGYIESLIDWINRTFHLDLTLDQVQSGVLKDSDTLQGYAQKAADNAWGLSSSVIGGLFDGLTVLLFTFYLVADGPRLRRTLCSVLPPAKQATVLQAWEIALSKTGGYLYSRAILALISSVAHYVLFLVLDVPYAPFLAIWVGLVSQFIPTVGTYLAILLPALIGFAHRPLDAVWIVGFAIAYQQVENYLLQPRVTARTVDIHPAVAFGAVIAGASLLGAVGALIAIPVAATLQGFMSAYIKRYAVTDPRALTQHLRERSGGGRFGRWRRGSTAASATAAATPDATATAASASTAGTTAAADPSRPTAGPAESPSPSAPEPPDIPGGEGGATPPPPAPPR